MGHPVFYVNNKIQNSVFSDSLYFSSIQTVEEIEEFKKKMIPSWPAAFCFLNIVLAIFACVLVTHASILKNANELCLKPLISDVKCSGIMASCKLEHSTLLAEYGLYVYAISMGISSVLMMFHSCCTKAR